MMRSLTLNSLLLMIQNNHKRITICSPCSLSHFTHVSASNFTTTRFVPVKNSPHDFVTLVFFPITAAQRTVCQRTSGLPRSLQIILSLSLLIKKVPSCFYNETSSFSLYKSCVLQLFVFTRGKCKSLLQLGH